MNKQPIEQARDADLRLSPKAMQRAAHRARELALQTGTKLVVSRDGMIEYLTPKPENPATSVQEPSAQYEDK